MSSALDTLLEAALFLEQEELKQKQHQQQELQRKVQHENDLKLKNDQIVQQHILMSSLSNNISHNNNNNTNTNNISGRNKNNNNSNNIINNNINQGITFIANNSGLYISQNNLISSSPLSTSTTLPPTSTIPLSQSSPLVTKSKSTVSNRKRTSSNNLVGLNQNGGNTSVVTVPTATSTGGGSILIGGNRLAEHSVVVGAPAGITPVTLPGKFPLLCVWIYF